MIAAVVVGLNHTSMAPFAPEHRQVSVNQASLHVVEAGDRKAQTMVLLHGYPETWLAFEPLMKLLSSRFHLLAVDLPGIGGSGAIARVDKRSIAAHLNDFIQQAGLKDVVLAGHDIGGMIAYSFLRYFPASLSKVIIMDTAVPGIGPWEAVKRNPYIWHFAFYAVPGLPEALAAGKERMLFDYFYNTLSANTAAITENRRKAYTDAYQAPGALKISFEWYRSFPLDEKDNAGSMQVHIPLMYVRGDKEPGDMEEYINGFKHSGIRHIISTVIPGSGHFTAEEQPEALAGAIADFAAGPIR